VLYVDAPWQNIIAHQNASLVRRGLERMLHDEFDLHHTTLQVDHQVDRQGGELLDIAPLAPGG